MPSFPSPALTTLLTTIYSPRSIPIPSKPSPHPPLSSPHRPALSLPAYFNTLHLFPLSPPKTVAQNLQPNYFTHTSPHNSFLSSGQLCHHLSSHSLCHGVATTLNFALSTSTSFRNPRVLSSSPIFFFSLPTPLGSTIHTPRIKPSFPTHTAHRALRSCYMSALPQDEILYLEIGYRDGGDLAGDLRAGVIWLSGGDER
ncbi:hypothetical protein ACLMJK_009151 [Lecanora helva]